MHGESLELGAVEKYTPDYRGLRVEATDGDTWIALAKPDDERHPDIGRSDRGRTAGETFALTQRHGLRHGCGLRRGGVVDQFLRQAHGAMVERCTEGIELARAELNGDARAVDERPDIDDVLA